MQRANIVLVFLVKADLPPLFRRVGLVIGGWCQARNALPCLFMDYGPTSALESLVQSLSDLKANFHPEQMSDH